MKYRTFSILTLLALLLVSVVPLAAQDTECEDGFRLFDESFVTNGPLCIPETPERVIAGTAQTAAVFAIIDEPLLAACGLPEELNLGRFDPLVMPLLEDVEYLGGCVETGGNFPFEQILEIEPDLIVMDAETFARSESSDLLFEVAPTVLIEFDQLNRLQYVVDVATVFDKQDKAQGLVDAHLDRLDEFSERLIETPTIAVVDFFPGQFSIYSNEFSVLTSFELMGMGFDPDVTQLEGYTEARGRVSGLSIERIDLLANAEIIIVVQRGEGTEANMATQEVLTSPLWQTLPAVQQDNVTFIDVRNLFASALLPSFDAAVDEFAFFLEDKGYLALGEDEEMESDIEATEEASD